MNDNSGKFSVSEGFLRLNTVKCAEGKKDRTLIFREPRGEFAELPWCDAVTEYGDNSSPSRTSER